MKLVMVNIKTLAAPQYVQLVLGQIFVSLRTTKKATTVVLTVAIQIATK